MVSVMSASRYQRRSSMYIRGLISTEFAEVVPIDPFGFGLQVSLSKTVGKNRTEANLGIKRIYQVLHVEIN